jgi:lipid-A-disaccharide synthase
VLEVIRALGYRKVAEPTLLPGIQLEPAPATQAKNLVSNTRSLLPAFPFPDNLHRRVQGKEVFMHIFLCAGEPSGDLHGANLVRALRSVQPQVECLGYGGERMEGAGCQLLYPLCSMAVMGVWRVLTNLPVFFRLLSDARRIFREQRPDAVVLIDYPGFNWWMARTAHQEGIPVFYFVPPQLWAWAGWRVSRMRRYVDHVLCNLPFEPDWYKERGVQAHYIGHPYFDELAAQRLDAAFLANQQMRSGPIIGLLPGSRNQEVEHNFGMLLGAAQRIHAARPDVRFLVACLHQAHREKIETRLGASRLPVDVCAGRTPEIIHQAHACIAVSGSVGLELLHHGKPAVVVYRVSRFIRFLCDRFMHVPYISLVNLLAGRELMPEYLTSKDEAEAISGQVLRWINEPQAYAEVCAELKDLRHKVALPGACTRMAEFLIDTLSRSARAA